MSVPTAIFRLAERHPALAHAMMDLSSAGPSATRCSDIAWSTMPCRRCGAAFLKIDLQGNRPPKAKNRQIRLLERAQSFSPFNSF
jgi:hypothetical protein